jgi:hypothetical protein
MSERKAEAQANHGWFVCVLQRRPIGRPTDAYRLAFGGNIFLLNWKIGLRIMRVGLALCLTGRTKFDFVPDRFIES